MKQLTAQLTDDWAVRGRVNCATTLISPLGPVDLLALTQALSEFSVPQRGWLTASGFGGVLPTRWCCSARVVAVEGAVQLLRKLPGAAWMHFGDLDAAGVQIAARIAQLTGRSPCVYVPTFAGDYLGRKLRSKQAWNCSPFDSVTLKTLSEGGAWLEQEIFILDERLLEDIASAFAVLPERNTTFLNT